MFIRMKYAKEDAVIVPLDRVVFLCVNRSESITCCVNNLGVDVICEWSLIDTSDQYEQHTTIIIYYL